MLVRGFNMTPVRLLDLHQKGCCVKRFFGQTWLWDLNLKLIERTKGRVSGELC